MLIPTVTIVQQVARIQQNLVVSSYLLVHNKNKMIEEATVLTEPSRGV